MPATGDSSLEGRRGNLTFLHLTLINEMIRGFKTDMLPSVL